MPTEVLLVGAGGHARVVVESLLRCFSDCAVVLVDEDEEKAGGSYRGIEISALNPGQWPDSPVNFHVSVGDNTSRARLARLGLERGKRLTSVIDPHAIVAVDARLDPGCFVAANAILGPASAVGAGCIINHGAIVDHDCLVESYCHLAPGAILGGGVCIGNGTYIGAGAVVLPELHVADEVTVGAGAVVTRDIDARGAVFAGVPARRVD